MQDSSFLIRGARIMESGCSLLLYSLITWPDGFNSGLGPVKFGMGRISPWAEHPGWVYAPTPFIRWRSGLALWSYALGLCTYYFLPYQRPPQPLVEASLGEGWLVSWIGCGFHVAIRGWFDMSFVAVKRLMIMMALFSFSRPFRLLLLIPLETFLVSPFSTSSTGLEASLINAQNFLWCFLSPYLPRGRFPRFPS